MSLLKMLYTQTRVSLVYLSFIQTLFIQEAYATLIYHKVLIINKTEQDTEQDTTYRYDQRSRMPTPVALLFEILINYYIWS